MLRSTYKSKYSVILLLISLCGSFISLTTASAANTTSKSATKIYAVKMTKAHLPVAPKNGTDDYRCFLLDPKVKEDSIIRSIQFIPQRKNYVHHAIIFRVTDANLQEAIALDRSLS